jgi:cell division protein FtsW
MPLDSKAEPVTRLRDDTDESLTSPEATASTAVARHAHADRPIVAKADAAATVHEPFSDQLFVALAALIVGVGCIMVYSASMTSRPAEFEEVYLSRHLVAAALGLLAACCAAVTPIGLYQRLTPWFFWVVVLLLVLVLIPGIGSQVKGARRWIRGAGLSIQPSELAKLALPLMTCYLLSMQQTTAGWYRWRGMVQVLWPTAFVVPLVLIEPDLGTAVFLTAGTGLALWLAGWPLRNFLLVIATAVPLVLGLLVLKPYQARRITGFLDTWSDFQSAPYQVKQALLTLGAGGWIGVGLGKGWQKLSFLPEANTDFVFAVLGEELGLLGTLCLLAAWGGLYVTGTRRILRVAESPFQYWAAFTLLTQLVGQALLNVAVVTAMVPPKGISHPLVSAGGSNLVVSLLLLGMVWGLSRPVAMRSTHPHATPLPESQAA